MIGNFKKYVPLLAAGAAGAAHVATLLLLILPTTLLLGAVGLYQTLHLKQSHGGDYLFHTVLSSAC